jgi:putative flippase GtrA
MGAQLLRFGAIGVVSTLAYLAIFAALRTGLAAQPAILLALLLTALGGTAANRRLTFGVRGSAGVVRHQAQGLVVFGLGLALTSGSLAVLTVLDPTPDRLAELVVLTATNLVATVLRFTLFRGWVFARTEPSPDLSHGGQR